MFLRDLILRALPPETPAVHRAESVSVRYVYFSASHARALHPDCPVVVGKRGAGKSFWWAALQNQGVRDLITRVDQHVRITAGTEVYTGFGPQPAIEQYPDRDMLSHLLKAGKEARLIWRTVVVRNLLPGRIRGGWQEAVEWVEQHSEEIALWLEEKDRELAGRGTYALILFDALDQAAYDWREMYTLIRGLLQVTMELRSTRRIRSKVFLRPDQMEESQVATFPDASKVVGSRIPLTWPRLDLYGLLWQYLANTDGGGILRKYREKDWESVSVGGETIWRYPWKPGGENQYQELFQQIAGRQGFGSSSPYVWLVNRLVDAHGEASPRTFLTAIRVATEDTQLKHPNYKYALHPESIRKGVWQAARARVQELSEDYPWIDMLMRPLKGLLPTCTPEMIRERWEQDGVLQKIEEWLADGIRYSPPLHPGWRPHDLLREMERLGVFRQRKDGGVDIPDIFWVGYGLNEQSNVKLLPGIE